MSITIKLFAALREALGESELQLELAEISSDATPADVAAVKAALANRGTDWREALYQPNLVHALNHRVVFTHRQSRLQFCHKLILWTVLTSSHRI